MEEKDPIPRFEEKLAQMGIMTEEQMKQVREEIASKIEEAVKFAEESWPFRKKSWKMCMRRREEAKTMRKLTMRAAINEALRQEMSAINVYVIGEDVGVFGGCSA